MQRSLIGLYCHQHGFFVKLWVCNFSGYKGPLGTVRRASYLCRQRRRRTTHGRRLQLPGARIRVTNFLFVKLYLFQLWQRWLHIAPILRWGFIFFCQISWPTHRMLVVVASLQETPYSIFAWRCDFLLYLDFNHTQQRLQRATSFRVLFGYRPQSSWPCVSRAV